MKILYLRFEDGSEMWINLAQTEGFCRMTAEKSYVFEVWYLSGTLEYKTVVKWEVLD